MASPPFFCPYLIQATMFPGHSYHYRGFAELPRARHTPAHSHLGRDALGEASNLPYPLWWMVVFPGIFITVCVMSFNLFGDGLRDAMDSRLRGSR